MNKQRKVVITTTYNEMGIIIDTKAEEVAQPNLQPTCNQLATDCISRQQAIDAVNLAYTSTEIVNNRPVNDYERELYFRILGELSKLPSAQPERKTGKWIKVGDSSWKCNQYM